MIRKNYLLLLLAVVCVCAHSTEYQYDANNRLILVKYSSGVVVNYAYDVAGNRTYSSPVVAPSAPVLNEIIIKPGRAVIYFSESANNGGMPISGYTVTCTGNNVPARIVTGNSSPIVVSGLQVGVTYSCSLAATNTGGLVSVGSASAPATISRRTSANLAPILMILM